MENLQDILDMNLQPHDLEDLKPEVKQIYDRKVKMQLLTVESIENFVDIIFHAEIEQQDVKYLKPDVRTVYEKRVAYHNEISRLLNNAMIDVTESVEEAHDNQEDKKEDD